MITVAQQVLDPKGIGGVSSEYNALMKSSLTSKYNFVPVILRDIKPGLDFSTMKFYYRSYKNIKPDIIHIRGAAIDSLNAIIPAFFYSKAKILVTVHGMYSDLVYISKLKKFISKNIIEKLIFSLSDGISCVYEKAQDRKIFKKYRKKMLQYVYNRGKNFDQLFQNRNLYRKELNVEDDEIIGVYIGRITKEKGIDILLKALKKIENKNFKFFIVGDGQFLNEAKKYVIEENMKEKVFFLGAQNDIYRYLIAGDIFVQPSLHENHSISLLEAAASKISIICTDVGGNKEIVCDKGGVIISSNNIDQLVGAIKELISNEQKRKEYSTNEYNYQKEKFNDKVVDYQLDKLYQQLLERK